MDKPEPQQADKGIRTLFPELTDEQLKEAEATLRAYFEIALNTCAAIDMPQSRLTMEERSNV